jgi:hypothetical protein
MTQRGGFLYSIIADVCAFANTNGGTIYIGLSNDPQKPPEGIANPQESIDTLRKTISRLISPPLDVEIDTQETGGKTIVRVQVPRGADRPYAIEDNKIYVRAEAETSLAVRDEIVNLVREGLDARPPETTAYVSPPPAETRGGSQVSGATPVTGSTTPASPAPTSPPPVVPPANDYGDAPRAGVEIINVEQKGEVRHYTMRDLRNGNIVKNVTRSSARRLWHYAITQRETNPVDESKVTWQGDYGLWQSYRRSGETRYDLLKRGASGLHVYYGVTEVGMHGPWQAFLVPEGEEAVGDGVSSENGTENSAGNS